MKLGITLLVHNKDDIEFVTEFPCFLGHPVYKIGLGHPVYKLGLVSRMRELIKPCFLIIYLQVIEKNLKIKN